MAVFLQSIIFAAQNVGLAHLDSYREVSVSDSYPPEANGSSDAVPDIGWFFKIKKCRGSSAG